MKKPLCIVAGVGPGNGLAFCNRFLQAGFQVAILARNLERLQEYAGGNNDIIPYSCDLSDPGSVENVFAEILKTVAVPEVVIYNAGSGVFGTALEISYQDFEATWRVNAAGLFSVAQAVVPAMMEQGGGSLLVTGATASLRGGARFAAFSAAKAAQRNLTQSLARLLGEKGIHVALVIIDGVIDLPRTRKMFPDKPDSFFLRPEAIAETYYHLSQQERSAWTFEVDLRPHCETW